MERGKINHIGMEGKSQLKYMIIYTTVVANICYSERGTDLVSVLVLEIFFLGTSCDGIPRHHWCDFVKDPETRGYIQRAQEKQVA